MFISTPIYQLEITLQEIDPAIWRRVQVLGNTTLAELHHVIQRAMGWEGYHLWRFQLGSVEYGTPSPGEIGWQPHLADAASVRLTEIVRTGDTLLYEYDFGDAWQHRIRIEKVFGAEQGAEYPRCIAGARACPPEECGGAWGYAHLLDVLADPADSRHEEMLDWLGGHFDPEEVDIGAINHRLAETHFRDESFDFATMPGNPAESALREIRAQAEQLFTELHQADPDVTLEELNAALGSIVEQQNRRPRPEFDGLSSMQLQRLLGAEWGAPDGPLQLDSKLKLDEFSAANTFYHARLLLELLGEQGEVRATSRGNLPRSLVAAFHARMRWPMWYPKWYSERNVLNEGDLGPLHFTRVLLEVGGLIKRRKGRFSLTRVGARLFREERAGELFATLFRTHFQKFNLGYLDGAEEVSDFQYGIAYTLWRFGEIGAEPRTSESLADEAVLPFVRAAVPTGEFAHLLELILETRFLRPLEGFGLAESHALPIEPGAWRKQYVYRKSALFDRFLSFNV